MGKGGSGGSGAGKSGGKAGKRIRRAFWLLRFAVVVAAAATVTMFVVRGRAARGLPPLERWHLEAPVGELSAEVLERSDMAGYLVAERAIFDQVADWRLNAEEAAAKPWARRYIAGSPNDPFGHDRNWNRTQILSPAADEPVVGAIVLLHGCSDSPYSMRRLAEAAVDEGYHAIVLRLPGHGTVPAALVDVRSEQWRGAARLAMRHAADLVGRTGRAVGVGGIASPGARGDGRGPDAGDALVVGGYSMGGSLALDLMAETALGGTLPAPDLVLLFSPAIGLSPFARAAPMDLAAAELPGLSKMAWMGVQPEYDPYKYGSFPKRAGYETWRLVRQARRAIDDLADGDPLRPVPPIVSFHSAADATVINAAAAAMSRRLPNNGSELYVFDVNRADRLEPFLRADVDSLAQGLIGAPLPASGSASAEDPGRAAKPGAESGVGPGVDLGDAPGDAPEGAPIDDAGAAGGAGGAGAGAAGPRDAGELLPFDLIVVTNRSADDAAVVERRRPAGRRTWVDRPTGLAWPASALCLSHVSIPFAADDPIYGDGSGERPDRPALGTLALRGERGALAISGDDILRIRHNPFFPVVERRVRERLEMAAAGRAADRAAAAAVGGSTGAGARSDAVPGPASDPVVMPPERPAAPADTVDDPAGSGERPAEPEPADSGLTGA